MPVATVAGETPASTRDAVSRASPNRVATASYPSASNACASRSSSPGSSQAPSSTASDWTDRSSTAVRPRSSTTPEGARNGPPPKPSSARIRPVITSAGTDVARSNRFRSCSSAPVT